MKQEGKFILLTREEFKEWLKSQTIKREIKMIQHHHTYSPSYKNFTGNNHFELVKNMENYHVKERKFAEIAQNITTFPDGLIMICRSFEKTPAGIYGKNTGSICIENLGNFDIGGDIMSEEHKKTIVYMSACFADTFKLEINTNVFIYHSWFELQGGGYKTCPGTNFFGGSKKENAEMNFYPLLKKEIEIMNAKHGIVTANVLNVRESYNTTAKIVKTLNKDTKVNILETKDDWYRIDSGQWVSGKYIKLVDEAKVDTPKPTPIQNSYMYKDCKVVEVNPLDLKIIVADKPANQVGAINYTTSIFQTWDAVYENGKKTNKLKSVPLGILVSEGKIISNRQPHVGFSGIKYPAGTLIVHNDGKVEIKSIVNIDDEKDVKFATSGVSILPKIRMNEEGFCKRKSIDGIVRDFSDVGRTTSRICIGYNSKKNKIIIVGMISANVGKAQTIMKELGCDSAISCDAGGSAILVVDGKNFMTTTRQLYAFIGW